jgi:Tol biopolymer transport system component
MAMRRLASLVALGAAALILTGVAGAGAREGSGRIAFMTLRDGRGEIDVSGPDGAGRVAVTTAGMNAEPSWSPDGSRMAYVCGNFSLCVMNADGSGQTALTDTGTWSGAYVYDEYPTWSPDGKKLAFQSNRGDLDYGIWVVGSNGSGLHRLAGNASGYGDYSPSWSPDGSRIAFVSDSDESSDIYLMYPDGGLAARLTRTDDGEDSPSWSPDGTKIVYTRWRGDFSKLWVMNADGSGQHALTKGRTDEYDPVWSPDGAKILFSSDRGGNFDLYLASADGSGAASRLTSTPEAEALPSWQPAPMAPSSEPPLPSGTSPVARNDAPLVSEFFGRSVELGAVRQAIFEARARHDLVAERSAYVRLASSSRHAAATLHDEHPTSAKGKRIQRNAVSCFRQLAVEGRERTLALDARRHANKRALKRHLRAASRAAASAEDLFENAGDMIG